MTIIPGSNKYGRNLNKQEPCLVGAISSYQYHQYDSARFRAGLHRHLIPTNWNGVVTKHPLGQVGLYWRVNREPPGNSFLLNPEKKPIPLPLGELAFEPPRRNITLGVILAPDQQYAAFPLEIAGGEAGITIGDVLRALYESNRTLQDTYCSGLIHGTCLPRYTHKGKLHDWIAVLVKRAPKIRKSALPH